MGAREHAASQSASLEALRGENVALQAELRAQSETLAAVRRRAHDHEAECKRLLDDLEVRKSELAEKRLALHESGNAIVELEKKLQAADLERGLTAQLRAKDQQREDDLQATCDQLTTGLVLASKKQEALEKKLHAAEMENRLTVQLQGKVQEREEGLKATCDQISASCASTEAGSWPGSPASSTPSSPRSPRPPMRPTAFAAERSPKVKIDQSRGMLNRHVHIEIVSSD